MAVTSRAGGIHCENIRKVVEDDPTMKHIMKKDVEEDKGFTVIGEVGEGLTIINIK